MVIAPKDVIDELGVYLSPGGEALVIKQSITVPILSSAMAIGTPTPAPGTVATTTTLSGAQSPWTITLPDGRTVTVTASPKASSTGTIEQFEGGGMGQLVIRLPGWACLALVGYLIGLGLL